ncbi:hypothetical protein SJS41_20055 [Klebsiella quasipneumoniae]|uniref:hypothetical protein n=1 Tax=Klebsiella quasipneumoniae TaxID=1463165 RepID=UPI0029DDAB99|nr:hypothetical protein [Klebsiella quasipneumoniae]MDX7607640.1 hypothetical protein [Klebsiella quasipneumoniae]
MNIETVNELIASLESAGELSIREQKFLKLAKAFKHLAAENVALKSFGDKLNDMHNALNGEGTGIQGRAEVACQQVALEAAIEEFDAIETPATDRIVAGIKADEEKTVLNDLLRHLDKIDIENLSSPWELSSEVVAFVNSRLLREGADK